MTPLVLLPGMMCDARLFGPQIAALSGQRTLICAQLSRRSSIEELASDILADAPRHFALAGLSMGGIVAMEMLRQAPDRVERVAFMDTNPLAEHDSLKTNRLHQMLRVRDGGLAEVMRDEMKPNYLADGPRHADILDLCMEMALDLGPEVFARQSAALRDRPDQKQTLENWDKPTLILTGAEDRLCPVHRHELMAELMPQATLTIIPDAGHLPTLERPYETHAALERWLEE